MMYAQKKDLWVSVLLLLICVALFSGALLALGVSLWKQTPGLWVLSVIFAPMGALVLSILFGSFYEITPTHLVLHFGTLRWKLPVESIVEVYSTSKFWGNDFGWGFALSNDRIRIKCCDRWMPFWISPEDKADFVAELARLNPRARVIEDRPAGGCS